MINEEIGKEIRVCSDCGTEFDENSEMCPKCGGETFFVRQSNSQVSPKAKYVTWDGPADFTDRHKDKQKICAASIIGIIIAGLAFLIALNTLIQMMQSGTTYFAARCALIFLGVYSGEVATSTIWAAVCSVVGFVYGVIYNYIRKLRGDYGVNKKMAEWTALIGLTAGIMLMLMALAGDNCSRDEIIQYELYRGGQKLEQWFGDF